DGRISGYSDKPTFAGHTRGERVRYDGIAFDSLEGDLTYSPSHLSFKRAKVQRGEMSAGLDLDLDLTDWSFLHENQLSAEVDLQQAPLDNLQQLFSTSYPVHGRITGQFHGHGTSNDPNLSGLFDLAE